MFRIALNPCSAPVLNRDQHAASIRAIVRTRRFDNLLHAQPIIRCLNRKAESGLSPVSWGTAGGCKDSVPNGSEGWVLLQFGHFFLFRLAHLFHLLDLVIG